MQQHSTVCMCHQHINFILSFYVLYVHQACCFTITPLTSTYLFITADNKTDPLGVRLVDGVTNQTGRIEIQYNGLWGTICERNFDLNSANVACRSLGFIAALCLVSTIRSGTGPIWLNNVRCLGNETSLEQCPHDGFGNHNCYHSLDIGVECIGKNFMIHYIYVVCY